MAYLNTTIDRFGVDYRAPSADVSAEMVFDAALNGNWEMNTDAAIDRPGFKMSVVVLGNSDLNSAIGGIGVQPLALPTVSSEVDLQATIDGPPVYVAGEVVERDTAVGRIKMDVPFEMRDLDATIPSLQIHSQTTWDVEPIADRVP